MISPGDTEQYQEETQSRQPVASPRFEPDTSWKHVWRATAT